jgi:riboflavin synthase
MAVPESIRQYIVTKGSIAVDGISLTVNVCDQKSFTCTIIPHTLRQTNLGLRKVGELVNLESDIIGRYVEQLMDYHQDNLVKKQVIDLELLKKYGWE